MQNTTTDTPEYKKLIITGDISIKPVNVPATERLGGSSWRFLIVGPTGAGKSSFIEALAGETQNLEISKDQLAGYTQRVSAYQVVNVFLGSMNGPIYLIDTPGFSDTKISELEIMEMVLCWLKENSLSCFDTILFLTPITQPRLAGSKRRTIEMFRALLNPSSNFNTLICVTTMWNQLNSERAEQRAEANVAQLRGGILKEFVDAGYHIARFKNTRDSALQILDGLWAISTPDFSGGLYTASPHLYRDLHERIEGALQQKNVLESELASPNAHSNRTLESILEKDHRENEETLTKFIGQLAAFGTPIQGFERASQDLRKRVAAEVGAVDSYQEQLFRLWAEEPEILEVVFQEVPQPTFSSPLPSPMFQPRPARVLVLKGLIRRIINVAKRRGNKWFKQRT